MSLDFQQVKNDFPIEKVVELLGIEVTKQRNGQLRGNCPIHGGNDPRGFVITPARNLAYCFKGCGGGDQLWLIAKVKDISSKEAAEWLVGGTSTRTVPDREPRNSSSRSTTWSRIIRPSRLSASTLKSRPPPESGSPVGAR